MTYRDRQRLVTGPLPQTGERYVQGPTDLRSGSVDRMAAAYARGLEETTGIAASRWSVAAYRRADGKSLVEVGLDGLFARSYWSTSDRPRSIADDPELLGALHHAALMALAHRVRQIESAA